MRRARGLHSTTTIHYIHKYLSAIGLFECNTTPSMHIISCAFSLNMQNALSVNNKSIFDICRVHVARNKQHT